MYGEGGNMKDQYVGDIGDYGKYSLLRAFADAGVKVGVNWYLTKNDGSSDGKFIKYLENNDIPQCIDNLLKALEVSPQHLPSLKFMAWLLQKKLVPQDRLADVNQAIAQAQNPKPQSTENQTEQAQAE